MERARQIGQQIGVIPVEKRDGFAEIFPLLLAQIEQKGITRKQAAKELGISANTLRRVLYDYYGRVPADSNGKPLLVAEGV
jgi:DNA-binding NtrC family response regulator